MASEIGPGRYLGSDHHTAYIVDTAFHFVGYFEGTTRHYLSPTGNRVLLRASRGGVGAGVIDLTTDQLAYVVPSIDFPEDAAWSPDGARLYLGGVRYRPSTVSLVAVDAETGDSLNGRLLDLVPVALAADLSNVQQA